MIGMGENPKIDKQNKEKNSIAFPPVSPSTLRRADYFLISARTENKPEYSYEGRGS